MRILILILLYMFEVDVGNEVSIFDFTGGLMNYGF